jgi:hypothetical protein
MMFFYGYLTAQADSFAEEFGYKREEAMDILLNAIKDKQISDKKGKEFKLLKNV